jgi:hypothetical protein
MHLTPYSRILRRLRGFAGTGQRVAQVSRTVMPHRQCLVGTHLEISVHDNWLVSYCVDAEKQEIRLHTIYPDQNPPEATDVLFSGVVGYQFEGDSFQNILFDVEEIEAQTIYDQYRPQFEEGQKHCWPGSWNKSEQSVLTYLTENGIKAYNVWPTMGMGGWVLAKSMTFVLMTA